MTAPVDLDALESYALRFDIYKYEEPAAAIRLAIAELRALRAENARWRVEAAELRDAVVYGPDENRAEVVRLRHEKRCIERERDEARARVAELECAIHSPLASYMRDLADLRSEVAEIRELNIAAHAVAMGAVDWVRDADECHFCELGCGRVGHDDGCPVAAYDAARRKK